MNQAWKPVAILAANAGAERRILLIKHNATGGMERTVAGARQIIMQLLDARLVRHRRERIGRAGRWLSGVFTARSVYLVHLLSLGVIRLHVFVADGPGGRDTVVVLQLPEVLLAQTVEGCAKHL